ncbi:hypothetical protein [Deminuibacter soli]|nr:hypothetical protein [Deminuibacter soli]
MVTWFDSLMQPFSHQTIEPSSLFTGKSRPFTCPPYGINLYRLDLRLLLQ